MNHPLLRLAAFAALAIPALSLAQFTQDWAHTINGSLNLNDRSAGVVVDSEGSVYVTGTVDATNNNASSDIGLLKYNAVGVLQWSKTFDGPAASQDISFDVALAGDGSVVVVGRVMTVSNQSDMITLKYRATDGELLWQRQYDGPAQSIDQGIDLVCDGVGNVFITGEVWNDAEYYSNGDFCTIKYSAAGELQWAKLFDGPATFIAMSDQPVHIVLDQAGDVIVSGDSPDTHNATDIVAVKYDGDTGQQLWAARYEPGGTNTGLAVAPNGDIIVSGNTYQSGDKVVVIRYDGATGNEIWNHVDVFPHDGRLTVFNSMAVDASGNPVIALDYDPDFDDSNLNDNLQVTKYDFATGSRIWSTSVGTSVHYDGQDVSTLAIDGEGNVMVAGSNLFLPRNTFTVWYFDGVSGELIATYDHPFTSNSDYAVEVVFDGEANAIAIGNTVNNNNGRSDMFAIKYGRNIDLRPVTGTVQISGRGALSGEQVRVEVRSPGSNVALESCLVVLDASGRFSFNSSVPNGIYDVTAINSHSLRRKIANVSIQNGRVSGLVFPLVSGDINRDNAISLADFTLLRQAFGSVPGDSKWNPNADLNEDGSIGLADFSILRSGFGQLGDD